MIQALSYMEGEGFSHSLLCREEGLYCPELGKYFQPEALSIVGYQRFEGNKDLGDVAIIYAIVGEPGFQGVIVDGYGTYADTLLAEYIQRLPISVSV
jgi:hypothetical protein